MTLTFCHGQDGPHRREPRSPKVGSAAVVWTAGCRVARPHLTPSTRERLGEASESVVVSAGTPRRAAARPSSGPRGDCQVLPSRRAAGWSMALGRLDLSFTPQRQRGWLPGAWSWCLRPWLAGVVGTAGTTLPCQPPSPGPARQPWLITCRAGPRSPSASSHGRSGEKVHPPGRSPGAGLGLRSRGGSRAAVAGQGAVNAIPA